MMREGEGRHEPLPEDFTQQAVAKSFLDALQGLSGTVEQRRAAIVARMHAMSGLIFEGKDEARAQFFARLEEVPFADDETFSRSAAAVFEATLRAYFTPDDIRVAARRREQAIRDRVAGEGKYIPLSPLKMLTYEPSDDNIVRLHVITAKTLGRREKLDDAVAGFHKLAEELQINPQLREVTTVEGTSWIIASGPGLLESFGFTVAPEPLDPAIVRQRFSEEARPIRRATMTREAFLARYGKK